MSFKKKELSEVKLNKKQTEKVTQFYKGKNEVITMDDLNKLVQKVTTLGEDKFKKFQVTKILVLNGQRWITFNDEDELAEYYQGKVKDEQKFFNFKQVQLTTYFE